MRGEKHHKIEMQPRSRRWLTLETIAVALSAFLLEAWGIVQTEADLQADLRQIMLLHLGVSGLILVWLALTFLRKKTGPEPTILALATLALGPLGSGGCFLVMFGLYFLLHKKPQGFMNWYETLFREENKTSGQELFELLETGRARTEDSEVIVSFTDFLAFGTPEQKQAILTLLAKNFRPTFAPALLQALNDGEATVRVMAATAAAHVEKGFLEQSLARKQQSEEKPDDFNAQMDLAHLLDDYGYTGLLDPVREHENRISALALYHRCASLAPNDARPWFAIGRLSLRGGDNTHAITCFRKAMSLDKSQINVAVWLSEALFKERRFGELRHLAGELFSDGDSLSALNENVRHAVYLWIGENA
jgi:tetratricopeptide (TPR) repeat protein